MCVGEGEYRNIGVYEYVKVYGSTRQDRRWNFGGEECRVSNVHNKNVCQDMNGLDSVGDIWSEFIWTSEEHTVGRGDDTGNVRN